VKGEEGTQVRLAKAGDLPAIRALLEQLSDLLKHAASLDRVDAPAVWEQMAAYPGIYVNLVAEEGAQLVGFLSMVCYRTLFHPGGTALVNELVVAAGRRRSGIGGVLVSRARELALERGMEEIEVGVELGNRGAAEFYRRQGFSLEYRLLGGELEAAAPVREAGASGGAGLRAAGRLDYEQQREGRDG
jgi:GNAT superfamily N-acetyltransferase